MESSRTKLEIFKPVFLKAGIPLAVSVASFIFARIQIRKIPVSKPSLSETQSNEERFCSLDSTVSLPCLEENKIDEEMVSLRNRIQDLQEKELKIEKHFLRYHNMKERELELMEFKNNLVLEMARIEFLGREISSIEEENKRFDEMVAEYLQVLVELEISRCENGLLRRKAKKFVKRAREFDGVIWKQGLQIEANEAEISRNHKELERKASTIKGLEGEIMELQTVIGKLQEEKNELVNKLEMTEKSALLKAETEEMIMEDYGHLLNELEQLQKDRSVEVKELIYLRWCNACLRHELTRRNQEQEEKNLEGKINPLELESGGNGETGVFGLELELNGDALGHSPSCLGLTSGDHARPRRQNLVEKFKRWVEGKRKMKGKLDEKEKHQFNSLGRHSVCDGVEEKQIPARNSCSSA
ncbi:hypothetical protein LguiB_035071 [Lonicera macranthoides]